MYKGLFTRSQAVFTNADGRTYTCAELSLPWCDGHHKFHTETGDDPSLGR